MSSKHPLIAGIDIGFSNVKACFGSHPSNLRSLCLPAGAGPYDALIKRSDGEVNLSGGERVMLPNGEAWASLVPHRKLQHHERVLYEDYPLTNEFLALYLGALRRIGESRIADVVIGLPVDQFKLNSGKLREKMTARLSGEFFTGDSTRVVVERVTVIPQPMGGYFSALASGQAGLNPKFEQRVCVIDPGFYSVDAVILDGTDILDRSSDTVKKATSVILETVRDRLLAQNHKVSVERLEEALRAGETQLQISTPPIDLEGHLVAAAKDCSEALRATLGRSMRQDKDGIDVVVLVGGGSRFFEPTVRSLFPHSRIYCPENPVMANAHGFAVYATTLGSNRAAA